MNNTLYSRTALFAGMLLFLSFSIETIHAQKPAGGNKSLKIGDQLPDFSLQMINYSKRTVRTSDFKGRLLILDFWSTGCVSCIEAFPKMRSLQKKYEDRIAIIPVTAQDKKTIEAFFSKRKARGVEDSIASAVGAEAIFKSFPGRGLLPKEVWIDQNGLILGITGAEPVNQYFIEKILNGETVQLPSHENVEVPYKYQAPLLINGNGSADTAFSFRSVLTPYIQGIQVTETFGASSGTWRKFTLINKTVLGLLMNCYNNSSEGGKGIPKNRIINSSRYQDMSVPRNTNEEISNQEEWKKLNCFNYELLTPGWLTAEEAFSMGFTELSYLFKVKISKEKRKMPCLVLTGKVNPELFQKDSMRAGNFQNIELKIKSNEIFSQGVFTLGEFFDNLGNHSAYSNLPPIVNETGYNEKVQMRIPGGIKGANNLPALQARLKDYGLSLTEGEREIEVLIIEDKSK